MSPFTKLAALLLLLAAPLGCGSSQSTAQCMVGYWRNPLNGGCLCPTEPECQNADCQAITFESFTSAGTYYSGTVTWSSSGATMSSEGAVSTGTFTVASGGVVTFVSSSNAQVQQTITCSGNTLTVNGANFVRADSSLSNSLSSALASSLMWKGYPISH